MLRRSPELQFIRRLTRPERAQKLAALLVAQSGIDLESTDQDNRFLRRLASVPLRHGSNSLSRGAVRDLCTEVLPDNGNAEILDEVVCKAISRMSGLRPNGIIRGMEPDYLKLDVNVYLPGEDFPAHVDAGKESDIVAVTLDGEKAFLQTRKGALNRMPRPDEIIHSWRLGPGQAMGIRNHQDAQYHGRYPVHAVQNGEAMGVTLLVQMNYDFL